MLVKDWLHTIRDMSVINNHIEVRRLLHMPKHALSDRYGISLHSVCLLQRGGSRQNHHHLLGGGSAAAAAELELGRGRGTRKLSYAGAGDSPLPLDATPATPSVPLLPFKGTSWADVIIYHPTISLPCLPACLCHHSNTPSPLG
jgi:hypothetical protein